MSILSDFAEAVHYSIVDQKCYAALLGAASAAFAALVAYTCPRVEADLMTSDTIWAATSTVASIAAGTLSFAFYRQAIETTAYFAAMERLPDQAPIDVALDSPRLGN